MYQVKAKALCTEKREMYIPYAYICARQAHREHTILLSRERENFLNTERPR